MVSSPRIYTRTGDSGTTSLIGGVRVKKHHPRLAAYGTVDELQSFMGAARNQLDAQCAAHPRFLPTLAFISRHLVYIQQLLFNTSCILATPQVSPDQQMNLPQPTKMNIDYLEQLIDTLSNPLPPLHSFILPGGDPATTALHVCRVVCRRAEREIETLAETDVVHEYVRPFVNRLSDVFFTMARATEFELKKTGFGGDEVIWNPAVQPPSLDPLDGQMA